MNNKMQLFVSFGPTFPDHRHSVRRMNERASEQTAKQVKRRSRARAGVQLVSIATPTAAAAAESEEEATLGHAMFCSVLKEQRGMNEKTKEAATPSFFSSPSPLLFPRT
jgi:hypothetical protein